MTTDGRRTAGADSRRKIVDAGLRLVAAGGLSALTISAVGAVCGMSKSGVFAHFRSKEGLVLAVIDEAEHRFGERVLQRATTHEPGAPRLRALVRRYLEEAASPGDSCGAFLAAVATDVGDQEGPIRDRLIAFVTHWEDAVRGAVAEATTLQHVGGLDPERFAFALLGAGLATTWRAHLGAEGPQAATRGRAQMDDLLTPALTLGGTRALDADPGETTQAA
jgi:AcrR family transcriptional regulator